MFPLLWTKIWLETCRTLSVNPFISFFPSIHDSTFVFGAFRLSNKQSLESEHCCLKFFAWHLSEHTFHFGFLIFVKHCVNTNLLWRPKVQFRPHVGWSCFITKISYLLSNINWFARNCQARNIYCIFFDICVIFKKWKKWFLSIYSRTQFECNTCLYVKICSSLPKCLNIIICSNYKTYIIMVHSLCIKLYVISAIKILSCVFVWYHCCCVTLVDGLISRCLFCLFWFDIVYNQPVIGQMCWNLNCIDNISCKMGHPF